MKRIKLSRWAKENDLHYLTCYRIYRANTLPVPVYTSPSGRLYVELKDKREALSSGDFVLYARVSSRDQKDDLARQMERLRSFAAGRGFVVKSEISEIGSGLNGSRAKLIKVLKTPCNILIEHKDRLTRFGFEYVEACLVAQDRQIIVMNETEEKMELVQDFVDVCTSMCARIYGQRSAKNKARKMLDVVEKEKSILDKAFANQPESKE